MWIENIFFEDIFNMTGDGMCITDARGKIILSNRAMCDMTGYREEELTGMNSGELISPDSAAVFEDFYKNSSTTQKCTFEAGYIRKDGTRFPVELKITNVPAAADSRASGIIIAVRDITERKQFEHEIRAANDELERKVEERTRNIEEVNTALRVLLKSRDDDRRCLEEKMISNVRELILPYIEKITKFKLDEMQRIYLASIANSLNEIISPFLKKIKYLNFTPTEIQIANFIKHGKNTKEIAELLNLSPRTVEGHRNSIRKKLNLNKNKANLRAHLFSLD